MGGGSGGKEAFVFIRDPEYAWIPCTKIGGDSKKALVKVPQYRDEQSIICDGGAGAKGYEEEEVLLNDYHRGVLPMQNVDPSGCLRPFSDMVELPFLHEVRKYSFHSTFSRIKRHNVVLRYLCDACDVKSKHGLLTTTSSPVFYPSYHHIYGTRQPFCST